MAASYNLGSGVLNVMLGQFSFTIANSLTLDANSAELEFEPASTLTTNTSAINFSGNGATGTISVSSVAPFVQGQTLTIDNQPFTISGISGSNLSVTYKGNSIAFAVQPQSVAQGTVATLLVGIKGATAFVGSGSVVSGIGVELANGTLALAVYNSKGTAPGTTYAFQATGSLSLVGTSPLALSGNILATFNNTGSTVTQTIAVDSNPADDIQLSLAPGTATFNTSGLTFSIASFVTITGNFGFQTTTSGGISTLAVTADNVNATMSAGDVTLTVSGASLSLLIVTANTNTGTPVAPSVGSYALLANGGTDALTGIPDLSPRRRV